MTEANIKENWYYFRSLANQLQQTEQFVDHSVNEKKEMLNGSTFSNEFAKILMLAASEFEVIAKALCKESGLDIHDNDNIVKITKKLLEKYPNIVKTQIITPYMTFTPLEKWAVVSDKVEGIDWWSNYNGVKHNRNNNFTSANLNNCVTSMASLMVLELYLSQAVLGNLDSITSIGCCFDCDYGLAYIVSNPGHKLPDF